MVYSQAGYTTGDLFHRSFFTLIAQMSANCANEICVFKLLNSDLIREGWLAYSVLLNECATQSDFLQKFLGHNGH